MLSTSEMNSVEKRVSIGEHRLSSSNSIEKWTEFNKRRVSMQSPSSKETNVRHSLSLLKDTIESENFPYDVDFEECLGIDDVTIEPSYMEFKDGAEGLTMEKTLTIQNVGLKPAVIRIKDPNSLTLKIKNITSNPYRLYPGLSLKRVVRYIFKRPFSMHASFTIEINGTTLDYHIICTFSSSRISVEPTVLDFGNVDLGQVSTIKTLELTNVGGRSAKFIIDTGRSKIDYIKVMPLMGLVKPDKKVKLQVQIKGRFEGIFKTEFWIKSTPNFCITIVVNTIIPEIMVDHPYATPGYFCLINFPTTFLGTQRLTSVKLKNTSSRVTNFTILNEINEKFYLIEEIDQREDPTFDAFKLNILEARLQPFEEIILTIAFTPTVRNIEILRKLCQNKNMDYFVAVIKIVKIDAIEARTILKWEPVHDLNAEKYLPRLYINNPALKQSVKKKTIEEIIQSEATTIYLHGTIEIPRLIFEPSVMNLGELMIEEKWCKRIRITNPSKELTMSFVFVAMPCVRCNPKKSTLKPGQTVEVKVVIKVNYNLPFEFKLEFELWSKSMIQDSAKKSESAMMARACIPCSYCPIMAEPKEKDPYCPLVSHEMLALEPNYAYTYTAPELEFKLKHLEYWNHYMQTFCKKNPNMCIKKFNPEFDTCERKCYSKTPTVDEENISERERGLLKKMMRPKENFSRVLTASQMFKISASPVKVTFGKVSNNTTSYQELTFDNDNDFGVSIALQSLVPETVFFPDGYKCILKSHSQHTFTVGFRAEFFGKFSSYLHYKINNNQTYQHGVEAYVVCKKLELVTKEVIFDKDCLPQEGFRIPFKIIEIQNMLNADTKFRLTLSADSNFWIEPDRGVCGDERRLCISVYHGLDPWKSNRAEALLQVEGGARATLKVELPISSPNVNLLEETLELGDIPLNISYKTYAVIYNAEYYGTFFEINEDDIATGISINPLRGYVPPRGILILTLQLKFDTCIEFSSNIGITVQKRLVLTLNLNGSVVYPELKFKPDKIELKRVSSNSYHVRKISVTNVTNCEATLEFLFQKYPEFKVTDSELKIDAYFAENKSVFTIAPLSTVDLYLHFSPCDMAYYCFYIPMLINDLIGPVSLELKNLSPSNFLASYGDDFFSEFQAASLLPVPTKISTIRFESSLTYPVLCFNKFLFEFTEDLKQDELKIRNKTDKKLHIHLILKDIKDKYPFSITWTRGAEPNFSGDLVGFELQPEEDVRFDIVFAPNEKGKWMFELPVNLTDDKGTRVYNKVLIKGKIFKPRIESSALEIFLLPMPLRIATSQRFKIFTCNYEAPAIMQSKVCKPDKLSGQYCVDLLKVKFPNGDTIETGCRNEMEVEIEFKSYNPVAFCTKVLFYDTAKISAASVVVYASADDSLLTTHLYRSSYGENFIVTKSEKYPSGVSVQPAPIDRYTESMSISSSTFETSRKNVDFIREGKRQSIASRRSEAEAYYRKEMSSNLDEASTVSEITRFNVSCYPFFPAVDSFNKIRVHAYRCLKAAEQWVYANVMHYQFNPKLPAGMTAAMTGMVPLQPETGGRIGDKSKSAMHPCTFIDVLERLIGPTELAKLELPSISEVSDSEASESNGDVEKLYEVNCKIIDFLLAKGANVAHVSTEFTLNYDYYKVLNENTDNFLPEHAFDSRCTQAWMDLILQSYKLFVLKKIDRKALEHQATLMETSKKIEEFPCKQFIDVGAIIHRSEKYEQKSASEAILLAWLEYHYNNVFINERSRKIEDFTDSLSDGLVLIAVTCTFCPFLEKDYFKDIYLNPSFLEEKMHNANCLLIAWKKIRLNFIVTPSEIVHPNSVQMLMLTAHLFKYLPTYLIKNKVEFSCPLTQSVTKSIKISVAIQNPVNYVVQFFGNELNTFDSKPIVSIKPKKSQNVKVTYNARKIEKIKVYIILCGYSIGPNCADNQTLVLEGFPDELVISSVHDFKTRLYQIVEKKFLITVPYPYKIQYDLWLSYEKPIKYDELNIEKWAVAKHKKSPRRLLLQEEKIEVGDEPEIELVILLSCMVAEPRSFWIVLRSTMADFIIQINSSHKVAITNRATIEMPEEDCICPGVMKQILHECPLNKEIVITSKNNPLLNCVLHMFQKTLDTEEKVFWINNLDNCIGLRVMKWLMRIADDPMAKEYKHIYKATVSYKIKVNNSNITPIPRIISIEDTKDDEDVNLNLHITPVKVEEDETEEEKEKKKLRHANVTFTSSDKKEIRVCAVDLLYKEPPEPSENEKKLLK